MKLTAYLAVVVTLIFITLKLAQLGIVVEWSWILVLSHMWGGILAYLTIHLLSWIGIAVYYKLNHEKWEQLKQSAKKQAERENRKSGWQKKLEELQTKNTKQ